MATFSAGLFNTILLDNSDNILSLSSKIFEEIEVKQMKLYITLLQTYKNYNKLYSLNTQIIKNLLLLITAIYSNNPNKYNEFKLSQIEDFENQKEGIYLTFCDIANSQIKIMNKLQKLFETHNELCISLNIEKQLITVEQF